MKKEEKAQKNWQKRLHEIIFEADTFEGKLFDITILVLIVLSVFLIMLESIDSINAEYGTLLMTLEWVVTIAFTVEYILRIICLRRPIHYIFSFYGLVDILSILPTYLGYFMSSSHFLSAIRLLRLLRIFRIFKLNRFVRDSNTILISLRKSRHKIAVFLFFLMLVSIILGTLVYAIENPVNPDFSSIPESIYWAIVTLSTVGYGDIAPITIPGKMIASFIMIIGYSIIAVPTGIITAEVARNYKTKDVSTQNCPNCTRDGHDVDAQFCKFCGEKL